MVCCGFLARAELFETMFSPEFRAWIVGPRTKSLLQLKFQIQRTVHVPTVCKVVNLKFLRQGSYFSLLFSLTVSSSASSTRSISILLRVTVRMAPVRCWQSPGIDSVRLHVDPICGNFPYCLDPLNYGSNGFSGQGPTGDGRSRSAFKDQHIHPML